MNWPIPTTSASPREDPVPHYRCLDLLWKCVKDIHRPPCEYRPEREWRCQAGAPKSSPGQYDGPGRHPKNVDACCECEHSTTLRPAKTFTIESQALFRFSIGAMASSGAFTSPSVRPPVHVRLQCMPMNHPKASTRTPLQCKSLQRCFLCLRSP